MAINTVARTLAGPIGVAISSVAALGVVLLTGQNESWLLPLTFLPVLLAVIVCTFEQAISLSLLYSVCYFVVLLPGGHDALAKHAVRAIALFGTSLVGALCTRRLGEHSAAREALLDASHAVTAAERLESAADLALDNLLKMLPNIRSAAIYLMDSAHQQLELYRTAGAELSEIRQQRVGISTIESLFGTNKECVQLKAEGVARGFPPGPGVVVCMRAGRLGGPMVGLLHISTEYPTGFTHDEIHRLREFASRIAPPLQRIRLQEGLEGLAFTDAMTGLYNFRYFRTHLPEEIRRAARYGRSLALLIIDADYFKRINDEHGHPAGNQALQQLASRIRDSVRQTDIVARYGGEEFAVILPEADSADALMLAERIRESVHCSPLLLDNAETVELTVSIGVARFPSDAEEPSFLVDAADRALYTAKRLGRNRVAVAGEPGQTAINPPT